MTDPYIPRTADDLALLEQVLDELVPVAARLLHTAHEAENSAPPRVERGADLLAVDLLTQHIAEQRATVGSSYFASALLAVELLRRAEHEAATR
jgi:hypothetical protein